MRLLIWLFPRAYPVRVLQRLRPTGRTPWRGAACNAFGTKPNLHLRLRRCQLVLAADLQIQLVCSTVERLSSLPKATRKNVAAIRNVARIVPLKVPETLETPPRRLR